jgi:RNA polymerase sigma factor (sigma-70 family)
MMTEQRQKDAWLEREAREAAERLLARHEWRLLDGDTLARQAVEHVRAGIAADAGRAAMYAYSHALYHACSGGEGPQRRNLGFTELHRYLYDLAYWRYRDIADDATQEGIERVFRAFDRCRHPGTFLAFAFQHLRDAVKAIRRQDARAPYSLDGSASGEDEDRPQRAVTDTTQRDLLAQVEEREQGTRLEALVSEFRRKHPRAEQQLAAFLLKHVEALDDETIAERLGKTVPAVHVLRSRAIQKLRQEPGWRALAAELGVLPEADVQDEMEEETLDR